MRASIGIYPQGQAQQGFDWTTVEAIRQHATPNAIEGLRIDGDPRLMEASFRLRYQVYCVERGFLHAGDYPDRLERDEFDRFSLHVGVVDGERDLLASSRLIQVSMCGLPLFRHCQIFPDETGLYRETNRVVEVSRLCVSRQLRQRGQGRVPVVTALYRALYQASKRAGFTHWLVATEHSLQRLVTGFGFPFRTIGPLVDYFGPVAPYLMDLEEFDRVILSGARPALDSFLDGLEPEFSPAAQAQLC